MNNKGPDHKKNSRLLTHCHSALSTKSNQQNLPKNRIATHTKVTPQKNPPYLKRTSQLKASSRSGTDSMEHITREHIEEYIELYKLYQGKKPDVSSILEFFQITEQIIDPDYSHLFRILEEMGLVTIFKSV